MKIALESTGKIGSRAARVLLAERSVEGLGLIGRRSTSGDPRITTITNLAGWDVVATDDIPAGTTYVPGSANAGGTAIIM